MFKEKRIIEKWLKHVGIKHYYIDKNMIVDVYQKVDISNKNLKIIPVQFGKVHGDFDCERNRLFSLKGCPRIVKGNFDCGINNLKSLEYCPEEVGGRFGCDRNKLENLNYLPSVIFSSFICSSNKLTSFKDFPEIVNGDLLCFRNNITIEKIVDYNTQCFGLIKSDFNTLWRIEGGEPVNPMENTNYIFFREKEIQESKLEKIFLDDTLGNNDLPSHKKKRI